MLFISDAVATADASTGSSVLGPDPMESTYPQYWEYGNPAGGTGPAPQPSNIPYTEGGQHAGGTGDTASADQTPYFDEGEDAGGV